MKTQIEKRAQAKAIWAYHLSPRCGARRKYDGQPCQSPAVKNRNRCRLHGGAKGSGAQKGNRNAVKNNRYTKKTKDLLRTAKSILHQINGEGI